MTRLRRIYFVLQGISFVRTLTVIALLGGLNTHTWADSFNEKLLDRISDLETCFSGKLSHHLQYDKSISLQESTFTKFYIFDRIVGYTASSPIELTDAQLEAFCENQLWLPYLAGSTATIAKRKLENTGELAPLGTAPIETDSWFIQFTHNQLGAGSHNNGHSNLTALALNEFQKKNRFSPMANDLIVRSSQLPDLYRWNLDAYHAQTPEYDPANISDRQAKLRFGVLQFQKLLSQLIEEIKRHTKIGEYPEALILTGVGGHLLQDLVYHRGMTLRQHAGLAYFVGRNPDFPAGELAQQRIDEAVKLTLTWFENVQASVASEDWKSLAQWDKAVNLKDSADLLFGKQDLAVPALMDYWKLHLPYRNGRNTQELAQGDCAGTTGVACWDITEVLKGVFELP